MNCKIHVTSVVGGETVSPTDRKLSPAGRNTGIQPLHKGYRLGIKTKVVTKVIGWHCRVLKPDRSNECIPLCLPIPLSKRLIKRAILEVVGNTINRSDSEK